LKKVDVGLPHCQQESATLFTQLSTPSPQLCLPLQPVCNHNPQRIINT
jgi:hypothetical protein